MLLHLWFSLIWYATWPCLILTPTVGSGRDLRAKYLLPLLHLVIPFNLICNMAMFWKSSILTYWPQGRGWGVCRQNICYHVAAFVILFNLVCNMTMFWNNWILTYWPHPQGRGGGSEGKIFATMLLHLWNSLIWYAAWPDSEKVEFWPQPLDQGMGVW